MFVQTIPITDRAAWLDLRKGDVTASDVAAVCGVHPKRSPLGVWAEKTNQVEPEPETSLTRRGRWLEPGAMVALRETMTTLTIKEGDFYLRDPELRLGATPDATARDPAGRLGAVQLKTVDGDVFGRDWQDLGNGTAVPPLHYSLQVLTEAMLLEAAAGEPVWAAVGALVIGYRKQMDFYWCPVERHAAAERRIQEGVRHFWQRTLAGFEPPVRFDLDSELLALLHPDVTEPEPLDWSGSNRARYLLDKLETLDGKISKLEGEKEEAIAELKSMMGGHEKAVLPGCVVTWKEQVRKGFTVQPSKMRRFLITRKEST